LNLATQTDVTGEAGPHGTVAGKPPPAPPLPPAEIAKLFPQLEILECLGRGGMGAVYKARQPRLDRLVALKILSPEKQDDPKFAERFEREARALARLSHPNIVTVYDFGRAQGNCYLLMEFVDGLTLRQLFHTRKLAPAEALNIVPKICEALQYAHNEGIVHRDIKPENILLDKKGQVKIADFGIAKIIGQAPKDGSLTGAKDVVGTPHYMAPEQIEKPATVDHRADIYSLGVVFYEMLTGELPLGKFQPPSSCIGGMQIDVRLDEVVLRALEKKPELRYQQVSQVKTAVETIVNSGGAGVPSTEHVRKQKSKFSWVGSLPKFDAPFVVKRGNRRIWNWSAIGINLLWVLCLIGVLLPVMLKGLSFNDKTENFIELIFIGGVAVFFTARVLRGIISPLESLPAEPGGATGTTTLQSWPAIVGAIVFVLTLVALHVFKPTHSDQIKSDYIGQTSFPKGDSIEIISVERTKAQMTVKGHYNLISHDNAELALDITSTNKNVPEDARRRMQISNGHGYFELTDSHAIPGWPHISMYADGESFATLYFGTRAEALEESKASWITNVTPASAETWSPALAPGERPDPDKVLKEAKELIQPAHYEESLQHFIWYHNHAAEFSTNLTSGWLINALSDWVELGRRYPKARQALIEIRDHKDQEFHAGRGYFDLFMEVNNINGYLQCPDDTCALFKFIEQSDPALAGQCYIVVAGALVNQHEYARCLKYIGDGLAAFEQIRQDWEREKQWHQRMDQSLAEAYQKMGRTNLFPQRPEMSKLSDDRFVGQTCQLIEILVGTGHQTDAEKIRDEAVTVLDDARLKSAVSDAEEKIQKRAASDSQPQTRDAVSAAQKWLALIDGGNYSETWKEASEIVQGAATEQSFVNLMNTFRQPLGELVSRKLKSAQRMTELPGVPDGQYVVMQFETSFAGKKSTIETVTFMLEKDGQWKSAGYFIK
jgi:serine/threonine protein kinase